MRVVLKYHNYKTWENYSYVQESIQSGKHFHRWWYFLIYKKVAIQVERM